VELLPPFRIAIVYAFFRLREICLGAPSSAAPLSPVRSLFFLPLYISGHSFFYFTLVGTPRHKRGDVFDRGSSPSTALTGPALPSGDPRGRLISLPVGPRPVKVLARASAAHVPALNENLSSTPFPPVSPPTFSPSGTFVPPGRS